MSHVRWGLIGASTIAREWMIEAIRAAGGEADWHGDGVRVQLPEGQSTDLVWQIASEVGEQVRYLRPHRPDLWVAHPIDALWASYSGARQ